jgi:hypothetical protein
MTEKALMIIVGSVITLLLGYFIYRQKKIESSVAKLLQDNAVNNYISTERKEDHDILILLKKKVDDQLSAAWERIDARKKEMKNLHSRTHQIHSWITILRTKLEKQDIDISDDNPWHYEE